MCRLNTSVLIVIWPYSWIGFSIYIGLLFVNFLTLSSLRKRCFADELFGNVWGILLEVLVLWLTMNIDGDSNQVNFQYLLLVFKQNYKYLTGRKLEWYPINPWSFIWIALLWVVGCVSSPDAGPYFPKSSLKVCFGNIYALRGFRIEARLGSNHLLTHEADNFSCSNT